MPSTQQHTPSPGISPSGHLEYDQWHFASENLSHLIECEDSELQWNRFVIELLSSFSDGIPDPSALKQLLLELKDPSSEVSERCSGGRLLNSIFDGVDEIEEHLERFSEFQSESSPIAIIHSIED